MSERLLPSMHFDSATLPAAERFERWRSIMAGLYDMTPSHDPGQPEFTVRSTGWHLGSLIVGDGFYTHQRVDRSRQMIRRDQVDHYKIVAREGDAAYELDADGNRTRVPGHSVLLEDLARPEHWDSRGGQTCYLYIARDALDDLLPGPLGAHGQVLQGGGAELLGDHLRSLVRHLPSMGVDEAAGVATATTQLIAACLAPTLQTVGAARPALEATLLRRMCRYIESRLEDPALGAESLCGLFHVSRSTLYRLFAPLDGVNAFIKERRLCRVHEALAAAPAKIHLGRLAEQHGFRNSAHFSREFRARFGRSPSEVVLGEQPLTSPTFVAAAAELPFGRWLQATRG